MNNILLDVLQYGENYSNILKFSRAKNLMAALKHNAYGLGVVPISQALLKVGCKWYMVSSMDEAIELRTNLNDKVFILCLQSIKKESCFQKALDYNIIITFSSLEELEFGQRSISKDHKVCLYFDTGLTGKGFLMDEVNTVYHKVKGLDLDIKVIMSHLSSAWKEDNISNIQQIRNFQEIKNIFGQEVLYSLRNTDGIRLGEDICDLPRVGRGIHGLTYYKDLYQVKSAFKVIGQVSQVKKVSDGNIKVGYGGTISPTIGHYLGVIDVGTHIINSINFVFTNKISYNNDTYDVLAMFVGYIIVDFRHSKPSFGEEVLLIFQSKFMNV